MAKYNQIRNIEELESVQRSLKGSIERKGKEITGSLSNVQGFYTPTNMVSMGIKKVTESIPMDIYLVSLVKRLLSKRKEKNQPQEEQE
ncbi:MAG: hypothetical protein MJZ16_04270 [Bacteroidales bacterium]|nr:hypothetical protein [Bacteroidales bacterium]